MLDFLITEQRDRIIDAFAELDGVKVFIAILLLERTCFGTSRLDWIRRQKNWHQSKKIGLAFVQIGFVLFQKLLEHFQK